MAEQFTDHLGNPIIPEVSVVQTLKSGTKIGEINGIPLYAPQGGGNVNVTQTLLSGVEIGRINNIPLYAPSGGGGSSAKPLDGKLVILCGDSQLGQAQDVDTRIQSVLGGTVINAGFGGCRMTYIKPDGHPTGHKYPDAFSMVSIAKALTTGDFTDMDDQLASAPDYFGDTVAELKALNLGDGTNVFMTIAYASNDFKGAAPMGNATSTDTTTYKGAINFCVQTLLTSFPRMTILLLGTPMRYYSIEETEVGDYPSEAVYQKPNGGYYVHSDYFYKTVNVDGQDKQLRRIDYNDAVLEQAKLLSLPCFDIYRRCGRNKWNVWTLCPSDGTHPTSEAGKQAEADYYIKILQTF